MSLQLILGSSGSGKSTHLYKKIIEASIRSPEKNFLVIVPEQFTMQTQKELVGLHPKKGLMNIDILSFQRLAHRIFEEVGADRRTVLEETGKTLLLRRTALKYEKELKILKSNLHRQGYLQQMKSLISELTQYSIDADKMEQMLEYAKEKPALYYRLKDVQLLYEGFQDELAGKYITAEETLEALCQVASRSSILKGCVLAIDGFTGFTPIQQKLLRELMLLASEINVTVTIDAGADFYRIYGEHELFYLSKKTIRILTNLAQETGCDICEPYLCTGKILPRFRNNPALGFLEARLFRSGRAGVWTKEQSGISLHVCENPVQEIHFAARTIRRLIREGYQYHDIAIIVGDMPSYCNYLPKIFRDYHIPCFLDSNRSVFSNPLIELIRSALEMVQQNFSRVTVFRYLRTGLCSLTFQETDRLENYVMAAGIRGFSMWKEPFRRRPYDMEEEEVFACEALRVKMMEPLLPFTEVIKSSRTTVREKTEALYQLICFFRIQEQLAKREAAFERAGQVELQKEYGRIYELIMGLFDKLVELLGEEELTQQEFAQILEAGFEEAKVGMIPPTADQIQVGDLERTRLKDIRVLFFLGLNDGWVPSSSAGGGLISDMDRETLTKSGVELAPTARQNSHIQKFYLYLNMTKPQEKLYLSCSRSTTDGTAMRPSYVLRSVERLFPGLEMQSEAKEQQKLAEQAATPENGIEALAEGLQKIRREPLSEEWLELYNWYRRNPEYKQQAEKLVEAAFYTAKEEGIGKEAAKKLYGEILENSVSRLEKFASCAFAHFLQYGLLLKEREEYVFHPVDTGRIFHSVMENFSRQVQKSDYSWFTLPDEVRDAMIDRSVEEVTAGYGQQILHDSARNEYMVERMKRIMRRTAWAVQQQILKGRFYPVNFEVPFQQIQNLKSANMELSEQEKMKLKGRIDRIDICETDEEVYVKVVDYKAGNNVFDLAAMYYGLQLQLVVYLNVAMEMEKRIYPDKQIVPAGIFYYHMKDPILTVEEDSDEIFQEIAERILTELKVDGLINDKKEILNSLDQQLEERKKSSVIPAALTKNDVPTAWSKTASSEQFERLSLFVNKKMQEIGREIMNGKIAPVPYKRKQKSGCDYCIFKAVCARDEQLPGTQTKTLKEYKAEEIWAKISGDEETENKTEQEEKDGDNMDRGTKTGN